MHNALVGVCMITYNHQSYVGQAIESIMSQITNFDFELVIGEDHSTDNTRAICEKYAQLYPGKIRLLNSDRNYGMGGNFTRTLNECSSYKYVAICEGDDFWTDNNKLQKQVDFLENNPEFVICFSDIHIVDELNSANAFLPAITKDVFTIEDIILSNMNIMPTPTLLFRNVLPESLPEFLKTALSGDLIIQLLLTDKGKAKYIDEKLAAYRNHAGGVTKSKEHLEKGEIARLNTYHNINEYFNYKYDAVFKKRFLSMARESLIYYSRDKKGTEKLKHYFKHFPKYLKYSDKINVKEIIYYHAILFFPLVLKPFKK